MTPVTFSSSTQRTLLWGAGVLGFALGGFFDGILLHQVLQWHHVLSLVPGDVLRDLRVQVLADGWFHVAVYVVASVGLLLLWRGRGGLDGADADRQVLVSVLVGFAVWQIVDVVGFHWLAGIHRIRVGVPNPLVYDIGWLIVVGLPPLLLAGCIYRSWGGGPRGGARARTAALTIAALTVGSGPFASLPRAGDLGRVAVFRSGTGLARALAAITAVDGRVLWTDASGDVVAFQASPTASTIGLYRLGALFVGSSALGAGCLSSTRS